MHLNVQYLSEQCRSCGKKGEQVRTCVGVWKAVRRVRLMMMMMMTVIVDAFNQRQTLTSSRLQRSIVRR